MMPPNSAQAPARPTANSISLRWAALAESGVVVCALAGIEPEFPNKHSRNFPVLLRDCDGWRREVANGGIDDLAGIMEAGIGALLAISARGQDCRAAALALWQEFIGARAALLELLPPGGELGPLRSA